MNTSLVEFNSSDRYNEIAALTGASVQGTYLPRLQVNRHAVNDDDKPIPMGTYSVTQDDKTVYGKTALFRTFINAYQYAQYDPKEKKYINRSVIIKSFNEEAIDMLGGLRCGKVSAKDIDQLNPADKLLQQNIKCARLMYGTVTLLEAVDVDAKKVELVDVPVMFKLTGSNFMGFESSIKNSLDAITKMKHHYFQHNLKLVTKRKPKRDDGAIFYDVVASPVLNEVITFEEKDMDTFHLFQDIIDRENKFVADKFTAFKKAAVKEYDIGEVASALAFDDDVSDI